MNYSMVNADSDNDLLLWFALLSVSSFAPPPPHRPLARVIYTESKQHCVVFDTKDWGGSDPGLF